MGLSCKPVGKTGGFFRKLDNKLEKERLEALRAAAEKKKNKAAAEEIQFDKAATE